MASVPLAGVGGLVQIPEVPCVVSKRKRVGAVVELVVDSPPVTSSWDVPCTLSMVWPLSGIRSFGAVENRGLDVDQGRLRSKVQTSSKMTVWLRLSWVVPPLRNSVVLMNVYSNGHC